MKTDRLIEEYLRLCKDNQITFRGADGKCTPRLPQIEMDLKLREENILKSLFEELPELEEFSFYWFSGFHNLEEINKNKVPFLAYFAAPGISPHEFRSWLVEVNLKENEVNLLMETIQCINFLKESTHQSTLFQRKDFLK